MKLKIRIILAIWLLIGLAITTEPQEQEQENENTVITYYLEHEDDQEQNFLEVTLVIEKEDDSLVVALSEAGKIAEDVKAAAIAECEKDDRISDCEQTVEVGNFEIQPEYTKEKAESIFETFKVSHEVVITIKNEDSIGRLVDNILKYDITEIKSFEWVPEEEKDPMKGALKEGIQKGKLLCKSLKLKYQELLGVEQIEAEQPDEEEEDPEEPPLIYKFQVECVDPANKAQPKKAQPKKAQSNKTGKK